MALTLKRKTKDPDENKPFGFNWTAYLAGDSITTSTWILPAGLTKSNEGNTGSRTSVFIAGGVRGRTYTITNRITTAGGRTDDRSFELEIADA